MFTNIRRRSLALAAVSVAVGLGSHQALATSQTGTAKAVIVSAINLTETTQMNFGSVIPSASAGTVVLAPATGTVTATGGATTIAATGAAAGFWSATGSASQPAVITLDSTADTLNGSAGGTMTIDTFGHDAGANPTFGSGTLTFHVGATLHVGANQTPGNYSGSYTVVVNY